MEQYIEQNKDRFFEELFSLLRIPSISAKPEHKCDMQRCAERLRELLLEAGADDYITKPFSMRELMARVKANIRRRDLDYGVRPKGELLQAGNLSIDPASFTVTKNGAPVELTQKEFDLLLYLIRERGRVFTREDLMQKVWNYDYFGDMRTVDVTVRRLREKIEDDPGKPALILTKRGVGYYFAQ